VLFNSLAEQLLETGDLGVQLPDHARQGWQRGPHGLTEQCRRRELGQHLDRLSALAVASDATVMVVLPVDLTDQQAHRLAVGLNALSKQVLTYWRLGNQPNLLNS
jgi:hypothetical protein